MEKVTSMDAQTFQNCPVRGVLDRIGDKWSVLVLLNLETGKRRFNELRRNISDISQRVLTETLRDLERDGYLIRTVHPVRPPMVYYELTERGLSVMQPLRGLLAWAIAHREEIQQARVQYDQQQAHQ